MQVARVVLTTFQTIHRMLPPQAILPRISHLRTLHLLPFHPPAVQQVLGLALLLEEDAVEVVELDEDVVMDRDEAVQVAQLDEAVQVALLGEAVQVALLDEVELVDEGEDVEVPQLDEEIPLIVLTIGPGTQRSVTPMFPLL